MLAWVLVVWRWQDPFTALYTHGSSTSSRRATSAVRSVPRRRRASQTGASASRASRRRSAGRRAALPARRSHSGQAIGRIRVPRLGLNMDPRQRHRHDDSLTKGPGRDRRTYMPGEGQLVYIAGHRTTYLAPFAHIERLRAGDSVTLEMPVRDVSSTASTSHEIVAADDLAVLRSHGTRTSSRSRRATRASSHRTATSPTRGSCASSRAGRTVLAAGNGARGSAARAQPAAD